ncbi:hypothetical protein C0J52_08402 [Blattella germanica]|nr:hypothetical protein C0J52_08402 [Blattella germanica]
MRVKHQTDLLHCYYNSLRQSLSELQADIEEFLPFDELKSQLRKFSVFNINTSIFNLTHGLPVQKNDIQGLSKEEIRAFENSRSGLQRELSADCRRRIIEIIEDSFDLGYL